jgi:phage terminase large subunit-like protein
VPELPLFADEAERALRIFKRLRLPDVIGQPTLAEATGDWFLAIVAALFGAYDPSTNRRMIQELFLAIPKKNGKSSAGGAVMVVALIVNRRPEGEFLLVAPTKEIADIAFKQASGTIRIDPELAKLFHIQRHIRTITHRRTGATLQIKAADTDVITGSKALGTMIDETHVFAKRPRAAEVFVELRGALAARPDGFLFQTTTQSKEPPSGVFKAELAMARDVRDGRIALPLLPIIYELPHRLAKDGGWKDRKYWPLVNPNMGRSVDEAFLVREVMKAEEQGQQALALIASQHFNVEIGLSLMSDRWAGAEFWARRTDASLTREAVCERSEVIVIASMEVVWMTCSDWRCWGAIVRRGTGFCGVMHGATEVCSSAVSR